ncbi:ABC transporter ATP-binding protein [Tepidibacillus infernus]|uniref:ABC transporter ATP-binding protein n=1 Tax=Tepidibacillus infernus TaxID=1806172 RepID=UPI003B6D0480
MAEKVLQVKDLEVSFLTYAGEVKAVRGLSFDVEKGEAVAIVGESGSGKSVTSQSIMKLIPTPPGVYKNGEIIFEGKDLIKLSNKEMEEIRGSSIGMIFQDPMTSLNPTMTVGRQISEGLIKHHGMNKAEALKRSVEMLELVGIPNPELRVKQYPHEFSGGMRQRVMIAIALACSPKLLIADEPTTALDVTIQAQILDLMKDLQSKLDTSIIIITHDLGVVADIAQKVIVMYAGQVVEQGYLDDIFYNPQHPYTWGLLKSVPRLDSKGHRLDSIEGTPPDLLAPPSGCPFHPRCPFAMEICTKEFPEASIIGPGHKVHCWLQHPQASKEGTPLAVGGANHESK